MKCCKTIGDGIGIFAHETFPLVRLVLAFTELPCVSELELTVKSDLFFTAGCRLLALSGRRERWTLPRVRG
jgi:hypothetical protein